MKNIISVIIILFILIGGLASCNKDEINNTPDKVGISRVTRFPTFTMKGGKYISIIKGQTFTDPGVTAKEGDNDLDVKVSGTVDNTTLGIYTLTYSAINKDGFPGSVTRTIAVIPSAEQAGVDISGKYDNVGSFTYTAAVQKLAPGFYFTPNCWGGGSAAVIGAYFFCTDGVNITVPVQSTAYGGLVGSGTLSASGLIDWTLTLLDQGPFTAEKKWQKQ